MFLPIFIITDGESKKTPYEYNVPWQSIVNNANVGYRIKPVNPYRDFMHGGTTLGYKGKNYYVADDKKYFGLPIGLLLKKIYG